MTQLQAFTASDRVTSGEFVEQQDVIIAYLQGFHRDLRQSAAPIFASITEIEALGVDRLVDLALSARALPPSIGELTEAEIREQARRAELARWQAVRTWFGEDGSGDAPWALLTTKLLDAIRAVIDLAERLIDRAAGRRDRAAAWDALARLAAGPEAAGAPACLAVACGLRPPRHLSGPEDDADQHASPGSLSWRDAPSIEVAAHLRSPGRRAAGAGTPARLAGNDALAARIRRSQEEERAHLARLEHRLRSGEPLRMSELHRLHPVELSHLLGLLSRAFAQRAAADGTRSTKTADGSADLLLVPPEDEARACIEADHGRLDCPDYAIELVAR